MKTGQVYFPAKCFCSHGTLVEKGENSYGSKRPRVLTAPVAALPASLVVPEMSSAQFLPGTPSGDLL